MQEIAAAASRRSYSSREGNGDARGGHHCCRQPPPPNTQCERCALCRSRRCDTQEELYTNLYIHMAKGLWDNPQATSVLVEAANMAQKPDVAKIPETEDVTLPVARFVYLASACLGYQQDKDCLTDAEPVRVESTRAVPLLSTALDVSPGHGIGMLLYTAQSTLPIRCKVQATCGFLPSRAHSRSDAPALIPGPVGVRGPARPSSASSTAS
ncbi:uncharacterized protein E0L32_004983 [Thyridium curvatum]|uniref:Uncharacterized protein n=1 Tax=Thyridium curvatum TaxID=1093900 RepID=A0A507B8D8_9PEZI|nr:uncharacterized protein E0L32_004983 [Thyridium curvatum]TPX14874.1 hypothetical protein E0L32_004983 [Thyridium curvatum]